MTVKLELYKIFKQVCDSGSFSEAAKILYISQSAVSQAMKQLESQTAIPLFRRTTKGVMPTGEGQLLYEYVSSAMDLLNAAEEKLEAMKNLTHGELKIGASDTISHHLLIPVLEQYSRLYPKIKLQIVNRTSSEAAALLKSGKIDLAFVNMPYQDEEITITPYFDVQDIFVAAPFSIWAEQTYTLEQIGELPLILLEQKANSRLYVERFFRQKGVSVAPEIELGSHDLLLEFAEINLGVSCVIREFSKEALESGTLVPLKTDFVIPNRQIGVASLPGVSLSTAARHFLSLLKD